MSFRFYNLVLFFDKTEKRLCKKSKVYEQPLLGLKLKQIYYLTQNALNFKLYTFYTPLKLINLFLIKY